MSRVRGREMGEEEGKHDCRVGWGRGVWGERPIPGVALGSGFQGGDWEGL